MVCCYLVPSYGPFRHFLSALLLAGSALGVYVAFAHFEVPVGYTPGPEEDATYRTARLLCILTMMISGAASAFYLIATIASAHEDGVRRRQEEQRQTTLQKRSWLTNFLDPQFLNTPTHIKQRERYFRSVNETTQIHTWGFLGPSLALMVMLLIRLFIGATTFLGNPSALDFGWKYGIESGEDAEKNVSFTVTFDSYGHAIQGFLAAFLGTPVVTRGLYRLSQRRLKWLFQIAPYVLTVYPTYNLVKRFMRSREAFAGSSFSNNGFEWAAGFVLGLALGQLMTSINSLFFLFFGRKSKDSAEEDCEQGEVETQTEVETNVNVDLHQEILEASCLVKFIRLLFALALVFTMLAAGVLYGMTWYSCLPDTTCINESFAPSVEGENVKLSSTVLSVMVIVPSFVAMLVSLV